MLSQCAWPLQQMQCLDLIEMLKAKHILCLLHAQHAGQCSCLCSMCSSLVCQSQQHCRGTAKLTSTSFCTAAACGRCSCSTLASCHCREEMRVEIRLFCNSSCCLSRSSASNWQVAACNSWSTSKSLLLPSEGGCAAAAALSASDFEAAAGGSCWLANSSVVSMEP